MRLTSDFFVSALVRRVFSSGGFAAIEKRGADAAGAIFIRQRMRDGRENLYGPAPQSFADDEETRSERRFELRLALADSVETASLIEKERRFDSDLWLVELETETVEGLFTVVSA